MSYSSTFTISNTAMIQVRNEWGDAVHDGISEGFDAPDLKKAKTLLNELSWVPLWQYSGLWAAR